MSGCQSNHRTRQVNQPPVPKGSVAGGEYELVWANPQIILADTVCTLIRASRIDSLPVDKRFPSANSLPSVEFEIPASGCTVSAVLTNAAGAITRTLLFRQLGRGSYRLSPERSLVTGLVGTKSVIVVRFCGQMIRHPLP